MDSFAFSARIDNVKDHVSIFQVMKHYNIELVRGADHENQVRCPFHGFRGDMRPSARVYPDTQRFHCFYCDFNFDVIAFVKEYEGFNFLRALSYLESHFNVPEVEVKDTQKVIEQTFFEKPKKKGIQLESNSLLRLYELCEDLLIKHKRKFSLKTYSRMFLFLDSTINTLLEESLDLQETYERLTKLKKKIEAKS